MITDLFPEPVVTVVASETMWSAPLHAEEESCIAQASPTRRREFAAGRACARAALARLGLPHAPLGRRADRTPRWPPGIVGCIAHCAGFCAAAVAREEAIAGLGLDAEATGRITEALLPRICSPVELDVLARLGQRNRKGAGATDWPTVVFSAKESTYKCYYPLTGTVLGFRDVEIDLDPAEAEFTARLVRSSAPAARGARTFRGRFASDGRLVFTGVTLGTGPDAGTRS